MVFEHSNVMDPTSTVPPPPPQPGNGGGGGVWLPVFTLLTTCGLGTAINVDKVNISVGGGVCRGRVGCLKCTGAEFVRG